MFPGPGPDRRAGRKSAKKPVSHTENLADFCLDPDLLADRVASHPWISTP